MKLSTELVAEMANMSKRIKEFDAVTNLSVASINDAGVQLSFKSFVSTFVDYVVEESAGEIYPLKYKTVAGGVLFYAVTNEAEVIKYAESK